MTGLFTEILKLLTQDKVKLLILLLSLILCTATLIAIKPFPIPQEFQKSLWGILLNSTAALFWIVLCLASLLITSHYRTFKATPKQPNIKDISSTAMDILTFFGQQTDGHFTTNNLSQRFKTTFNQTQFAVDELTHCDFLCADVECFGDQTYCLSTAGRAFLGERKLL